MKDCMDCEKLYNCKDTKCPNWKERLKIQEEWDKDFMKDYANEMFWQQQRGR